jgi:Sap, sulfolipid-1-addressing protein
MGGAVGETAPMPNWMAGIASFTPGKSLGIGVGIGALNPKNLAVGLSAALLIASAGLSTGAQTATVAVYVVVAAIGVAAPFVAAVAMGTRSTGVLDGWKSWLGQDNAAVMAVLFAVIGVLLIGKGITGLSS